VDFLYISHTLHHFYRAEAAKLLGDGIRTLKPGGSVRVVVPDLEYIMSLYQQGKRERALSYFFMSRPAANCTAAVTNMTSCYFVSCWSQPDSVMFAAAPIKKGRTPDLGCLDRMPEELLFVEVRRPACS
jgi:hypothetical protein